MKQASLIATLIHETGLSEEQATHSLMLVADFAKEKLPVLRGNINRFLESELSNDPNREGFDQSE
jgi:hypothetical protein